MLHEKGVLVLPDFIAKLAALSALRSSIMAAPRARLFRWLKRKCAATPRKCSPTRTRAARRPARQRLRLPRDACAKAWSTVADDRRPCAMPKEPTRDKAIGSVEDVVRRNSVLVAEKQRQAAEESAKRPGTARARREIAPSTFLIPKVDSRVDRETAPTAGPRRIRERL